MRRMCRPAAGHAWRTLPQQVTYLPSGRRLGRKFHQDRPPGPDGIIEVSASAPLPVKPGRCRAAHYF